MASFWPIGAPRAIQDVIFSTFEALWGPKGRQKEPQRAQRRPKSCPKCAPRAVKATLKAYFFENRETLFFDDSYMIFMVFCGPGGSLGRPKSEKKRLKGEMEKKKQQISFFFVCFALVEFKERFSCRPWPPGSPKTGVGGMPT